jgi:hypothetical protein
MPKKRLSDKVRQQLTRELLAVKERLRKHARQVTYERYARSLSEHIADIKRRDEIEKLLTQ